MKIIHRKSKVRNNSNHNARKNLNTNLVNKKKSLSRKVFLYFFIAVLVSVSVVGITSYSIANHVIKTKVTEASEQTIIQAGDKLDYIFNNYQNRVKELLHNKEFSNSLSFFYNYDENDQDDALAVVNTRDILSEAALTDDNMDLHLINLNHDVVVSSTDIQEEEKEALMNAKWVQQSIDSDENLTWTGGGDQITQRQSEGGYTIKFTNKLNIHNNDYLLIVEIDSELFKEELKDVTFGESGLVKIVDENNNIVFSYDEQEIHTENNLPITVDSDKNVLHHDDQLIFQHQSDINDWYVTGAVSENELTKDTNIIFLITIGIIVLAIIVSFIFGRRIARMISTPLAQISKLMSDAQEGDFSVRSDLSNRSDEIGMLATRFNEMLGKMANMLQQTREASSKVFHAATELTEAANTQLDSAKEVAAASEDIANGAMSLTEEAENGNTLASQIHNEVDNVFKNNTEMEKNAQDVLKRSVDGIFKMDELVQQTQHGEQMTKSIREKASLLNDSTDQISEIMNMLTSISDQTNLLSLNAAIEAARAGEAGKGFGVVADEIRKLSLQSKESIDRVGQITSDIVHHINETLTVLEESSPVFEKQVDKAEETDEILNNVSNRMNEFTEKIKLVSASIDQLRKSQEILHTTISQVSATAEESSAISEEVNASTEEQTKVSDSLATTADELKNLSEDLERILEGFKV